MQRLQRHMQEPEVVEQPPEEAAAAGHGPVGDPLLAPMFAVGHGGGVPLPWPPESLQQQQLILLLLLLTPPLPPPLLLHSSHLPSQAA